LFERLNQKIFAAAPIFGWFAFCLYLVLCPCGVEQTLQRTREVGLLTLADFTRR
jgi:hypothetical protein